MGCGKSTVGHALSEHLGWPFVDLDQEIEKREGTTISEIFESRDEAEFRRIESEVLKARVKYTPVAAPTLSRWVEEHSRPKK